jgi:hypothetical protein
MTTTIPSEPELFRSLLKRMEETGSTGHYPASFVTFVDQMIACLSSFNTGSEVLRTSKPGRVCPCCGQSGSSILASVLDSLHSCQPLRSCNRHVAALALDLIGHLPEGVTLEHVNGAMGQILGLDREGPVEDFAECED